MHDYLLLLHESPAETARLSPTEMQALVERYVAWSQAIASQGRLVSGHKLRDEGGRIVRRAGQHCREPASRLCSGSCCCKPPVIAAGDLQLSHPRR